MDFKKELLKPEFNFLKGGGEMGELIRSYNWAETAIDTPDKWPETLRTTLGIILHSAFPMFLFWGEDLICFYNDAYRPSLGINGKHPAIGKNGKEVWPDIWNFIGPLIDKVKATCEPVWFEDQYLPIYRNGQMEDVYWTFSYSPIFGSSGTVDGVFVTCTETTEKVAVVKKLLESEQRFQNLVRDAAIGIIVLEGEEMSVKVVNDAYGRLINSTPADLLNKKLFDVIPAAEAYYAPLINNVRNTGQPVYLYDSPYTVDVNGKQVSGYLNVVYQPYREEGGAITGVIALLQDVTESVLSRLKSEESNERAKSIVEGAPFPIGVYTGKEMRIELANQTIMDVWGKGNDVVGKLYSEILPELDNQAIFEQLDQVYTTGEPFHAKNQRVDIVVDGRLQPYYFNYSFTPLFDGEGKVYGVMNTAGEVTDLIVAKQKVEKSEQNLRNMVLQAPVAMCIMLGPGHVVEVANDLMLQLWGKPVAEVIGKPIFEGLPDARGQGLEELLGNVYKTGVAFKASEMPVQLLRNGQWDTIYQNFVYEPYRNTDGTVLGVLAVTIDVTEQVLARRKIEEIVAERTKELAAANQNLQRSNAELAQFAYIASHDLQEPVRKVSTFAQMLETNLTNADERSKKYIDKIRNSSTRMQALIRDVLAYSELSRVNDPRTPVDLNKIIADIKTDFELLIEQKQAVIRAVNLPTIPAVPLHMGQLFGNLISNALKFSKSDAAPVITIAAGTITKDELQRLELNPAIDYCKIEVTDNGIGFDQEYANRIFSIFQRLHRKVEYEGTGIGLAMCQKIVQQHQGALYAVSELGKGATFTIVLPK